MRPWYIDVHVIDRLHASKLAYRPGLSLVAGYFPLRIWRVFPGIELVLRQMRPRQQCVVRCESRFAYGPDGCPATEVGDNDLPPGADIELLVELLEVLSTTSVSDMTPEETIAEGQRKKVVGNGHFARMAYKKALRSYSSAHNTIAELEFPNQDTDLFREARQLRIDCGNNVATACVRLGELEKAKEAVIGVLELDPVNVKALFRAGQVSSLQSNFMEAKVALQKALHVNPNSKEIQAELRRLSARVTAYRTKTQAMQEAMGRSLFAGVTGEANHVQGNGAAAVVVADAAGQSPQSANAARKGDNAIDRVGLSQAPEKETPSMSFVLGWWCRSMLAYVLVALVAWGAIYVIAR